MTSCNLLDIVLPRNSTAHLQKFQVGTIFIALCSRGFSSWCANAPLGMVRKRTTPLNTYLKISLLNISVLTTGNDNI